MSFSWSKSENGSWTQRLQPVFDLSTNEGRAKPLVPIFKVRVIPSLRSREGRGHE